MKNTEITKDVRKVATLLSSGQVVVIPTETVYGLAASINSDSAIEQIFAIKQRPANHPLIVHIYDQNQLLTLVKSLPTLALKLTQEFWPGPLTLLLPKSPSVSNLITASSPYVAIRQPQGNLLQEVLKLTGPIVAPSANPFTQISPTTVDQVYTYFKEKIPAILDGGKCEYGLESTIIEIKNSKIIVHRLGAISTEELSRFGPVEIQTSAKNKVVLPGSHHKHYAPRTPLILSNHIQDDLERNKNKRIALIVLHKHIEPDLGKCFPLSTSNNLQQAASNLYSTLHKIDQEHFDIIIAEKFPNEGLGKAINDRLSRASISFNS